MQTVYRGQQAAVMPHLFKGFKLSDQLPTQLAQHIAYESMVWYTCTDGAPLDFGRLVQDCRAKGPASTKVKGPPGDLQAREYPMLLHFITMATTLAHPIERIYISDRAYVNS